MNEISEEELKMMDCPYYKSHLEDLARIERLVNNESISALLSSVSLQLVSYKFFKESTGEINQIYLINSLDKSTSTNRELVLKVLNPQNYWYSSKEGCILEYLREHTTIPVPNVLSYSYDADTSILKCKYVLMEKVEGKVLGDILPEDSDTLPDSFIDDFIDYTRQFKNIKIDSPHMIGAFGENMELVPHLFFNKLYDNFYDFKMENMRYGLSQMKLLKRYKSLAEKCEKRLDELADLVNRNPECNKLNFDSERTNAHGDFNETNIIVDPDTYKVKAILDWEWSGSGFFQDLDYLYVWFWKNEKEVAKMKNRLENRLSKFESITTKEIKARKLRGYLNEFSIWIIIFCTCQAHKIQNNVDGKIISDELAVRQSLEKMANFLKERLEAWDKVFSAVKDELFPK